MSVAMLVHSWGGGSWATPTTRSSDAARGPRGAWPRRAHCASLLRPTSQPPIMPKVCSEGDTSNFEAYPESDWDAAAPVSPKDLEVFKNF